MAELWKIDENGRKSGFFRALPWLTQSGIVRAVLRGAILPARVRRCRSSVVEHVLGKDGVGSSILLGSTTSPPASDAFLHLGDARIAIRLDIAGAFTPHEHG